MTGLGEAQPVKSGTDPRVESLRLLFRSLSLIESENEASGVMEITAPNGVVWTLADIQALYRRAMQAPREKDRDFNRRNPTLPLRQRQAIHLFLYCNLPEATVAEMMGLSPTNPIGKYATTGLTKLLMIIDKGLMQGFRVDPYVFAEMLDIA